jgi:sugar phosphate isomerase/epimerase
MRITRREFVAASACGAASLALRRFAWATDTKERLPLAFSTLGCPAWEWPKILEFAESHGFAAIELRGLMGSMDLRTRPEFAPERIAQRKKEVAAHGLKIANIGSSSALHDANPAKRAQQIADAKRFIDLASALGSPYVRVFGNEVKDPKEEVVARVAAGLHELGEYAGPRGVTVIIESHGDFVDSPTLKEILTRADSPNAALLWDAHHTYADGHEQPEYTVHELGSWIRHTHLKDSVLAGKERKYVLTGRGDVPIQRQVQALQKIGYKGYYCFEWEKAWHPELEDPEIAIADYAKVVGGYFQ